MSSAGFVINVFVYGVGVGQFTVLAVWCRPVQCIGKLVQAGAVYWLGGAGRCTVLVSWCRLVHCIGKLVQAGAVYWLFGAGRCKFTVVIYLHAR